MHNIRALDSASDVAAYLESQWRSVTFRDSQRDAYGYVHHWVARFSLLPTVVFDMDTAEVEHSHFTPWFNAFHGRPYYTNDAVHDLFLLHEIIHRTTMSYDPRMSYGAWLAKMMENETRTALESECMVYFELPDLREQSFPFEIWVDRFLGKPLPDRRKMLAYRRIAQAAPADDIEMAMALYPSQNAAWGEVWRSRYRHVESHMSSFVTRAMSDRAGAVAHHIRWLTGNTGMTQGHPYPFPAEAEAFAGIFRNTKAVMSGLGQPAEQVGGLPKSV